MDTESKKEAVLHGFNDEPYIGDVKARKCELRVTSAGNFLKTTLTKIGDVGRFVVTACELPHRMWKPYMGMVSETFGVDRTARLPEDSQGVKFEPTRISPSQTKDELDRI